MDVRFPDAAAVSAADDKELLSVRGLGPGQMRKLRARYPRPAAPIALRPMDYCSWFDGELANPLRTGAHAFAPTWEVFYK